MVKKEFIKKLLLEIKESLNLTGNKFLFKIFDNFDFSNDEDLERLNDILNKYNNNLFIDLNYELNNNSDEDDDEEKKKQYYNYIYLNNLVINYRNIDKISLFKEFNIKKNKINYGINFTKKYPSPEEESFNLYFDSEDERDKNFDILRGKLKIVGSSLI